MKKAPTIVQVERWKKETMVTKWMRLYLNGDHNQLTKRQIFICEKRYKEMMDEDFYCYDLGSGTPCR